MLLTQDKVLASEHQFLWLANTTNSLEGYHRHHLQTNSLEGHHRHHLQDLMLAIKFFIDEWMVHFLED